LIYIAHHKRTNALGELVPCKQRFSRHLNEASVKFELQTGSSAITDGFGSAVKNKSNLKLQFGQLLATKLFFTEIKLSGGLIMAVVY